MARRSPAPSHAVGQRLPRSDRRRERVRPAVCACGFHPGAAPVAVVNEPFVEKFLGGRNPIGRRIRIERPTGRREAGAVARDRRRGARSGSERRRSGAGRRVLRAGSRRVCCITSRVRTTGRSADADRAAARGGRRRRIPICRSRRSCTLEDAGREERAFLIGIAPALTAMGGMALLLSIVGIYALLSFMVTRRTREIGIRVALGATRTGRCCDRSPAAPRSIWRSAACFGTALGIVFVQMRSVILISIPAPGVWMPATIFLTLAIAGAVACWVPARRALGIVPRSAATRTNDPPITPIPRIRCRRGCQLPD